MSFRTVFFVAFLVVLSLVASRSALANQVNGNEQAAYDACQSSSAIVNAGSSPAHCGYFTAGADHASASCTTGWASGSYYNAVQDSNGYVYGPSWFWCVPATCSGSYGSPTNTVSTNSAGATQPDDGNGCCVAWVGTASWTYDGISGVDGYFNRTGTRCDRNFSVNGAAPVPGQAKQFCDPGAVSCYNPQENTACYTTGSGEQICKKLDGASNCATGATGSACYGANGTPPPPPPDPPISKGQPPDHSGSATTSSGGTTNNYTFNDYSGTSPGPGPVSSSSSSDTTSGTSGSNQNGSGNSPGPNGDHGTDSAGKCPDGSVPTASGCSGTATDNGCDSPPACFGDAVMCASFREQVAIRCNTAKAAGASSSSTPTLADVPGALADAGVPSDGGASGDPGTSGLVTSSDLGQDGFDTSGLGFARSCPASPTFVVLGHSYTLDLTPFCNFAGMLGWFVLLCGFLVGLRVVASGRA